MNPLFAKRRLWVVVPVLVLLPFFDVQACGPDFRPDVFVRASQPDDVADFGRGQLGLLQPTYLRRDLIVAYRYLGGGKLSAAEEAEYIPPAEKPDAILTAEQYQEREAKLAAALPANIWRAERAKYPGAPNAEPLKSWELPTRPFPNPDKVWRYDANFLNCPDNAFQTAVLTLKSRAKSFGSPSAALSDWLSGQDAVFSNCTGETPAIPKQVSSSSPALLRADRDYQIASANFYAMNFADAERQFEAIAADASSPWQMYGGYLAARSLVRQAFLSKPPSDNCCQTVFDPALMTEAQKRLEGLLHDPAQARMHGAIQAELNFVRLRTEPSQRLQEIATALAGPQADPNFGQDLIDLTFSLDQRFNSTDLRGSYRSFNPAGLVDPTTNGQTYMQASDLRKESPLIDWLLTFQSPSEDAHQHALQQWQQTKSLPWLTAAMAKSEAEDSTTPALLAAAAELSQSSSAYTTITFHRARLLIALNRRDEARSLLDTVLPEIRKVGSDSATNAYLGLRMETARTLAEFLTDAPRKMQEEQSQAANIANCWQQPAGQVSALCSRLKGPQFDADAAEVLNFQFPLQLLVTTAKSPALAENLRQPVAIIAWVRSVLLDDAKTAADLAPLLPEAVRKTAGDSIGFPATLAMLRNPGMQPYFIQGVQRAETYDIRDEYRDNWWCADWSRYWSSGDGYQSAPPNPAVRLSFLSEAESAAANQQVKKLLSATDPGSVWLGQRVLEYAKPHPDDPDVPEALALTVRATHFGCSTQENEPKRLATAKAAFELLHRRYPNSEWAKKTKVYS